MFDFSFSESTLGSEIRTHHFRKYYSVKQVQKQKASDIKREIIADALKTLAEGGLSKLAVKPISVKNKTIYQIENPSDDIIVSRLSRIIRIKHGIRQQSRDIIIACLKRFLEEGGAYRIYKLDIADFFESVNTGPIIRQLQHDPIAQRMVEAILDRFKILGVKGLPRGLSLSSVLAEVLLQKIDDRIKSDEHAFYYARFVDDMIIITAGDEDEKQFLTTIQSYLTELDLQLNRSKQMVCSTKDGRRMIFDYLGYSFYIPPSKSVTTGRLVEIDIAVNKIKKIQTRLVLAFLDYLKENDFALLKSRIKFLCNNYSTYDHQKGTRRLGGIAHSYRFINKDEGLRCLDRFYRSLLLSKTGRLSNRINRNLGAREKRSLMRLSFRSGFYDRVYCHDFSQSQMKSILSCW